MANLRGGNYDKQIKNAFCRLAKFGEGRHGKDDHFTHSDGLAKKREMYLRDFKSFAEENNLTGKLNSWMGDQGTMREFMHERIADLSIKSAKDYVAGFNSMLKGLREANISIDRGADRAIDLTRHEIQSWAKEEHRIDRAFTNPGQIIQNLYQQRYESGVLAEVQRETGLRTSEAYELVKNPEKYIENNEIKGIIGKGNHEYITKIISNELVEKIQKVNELPSQNTYINDIKEASNNPDAVAHDWRYTFAKELMEKMLANGKQYEEALKEVSEKMNHHREAITEYYLARA